MAEEQRFELWRTFVLPVFKTGAIDHSAIPPQSFFIEAGALYRKRPYCQKILKIY